MMSRRVFYRVGTYSSHFDPLQARLMRWLLFAWVALFIIRERLAFTWSGASCAWPTLPPRKTVAGSIPAERIKGVGNGNDDVVHVAVIADPQLTDHSSYRSFAPKGSWTLAAVERLSDVYMRRAFRSAVLPKAPRHLLFLGDLLDGGHDSWPDDWDRTRRRFDRVFRWPRDPAAATVMKKTGGTGDGVRGDGVSTAAFEYAAAARPISYHTIHGNHDVGYSHLMQHRPEVIDRHEEWFGGSNYVVTLGGVDVVAVDTMALDGARSGSGFDPADETNATWSFVEELGAKIRAGNSFRSPRSSDRSGHGDVEDESQGQRRVRRSGPRSRSRPRVLLSHLPLPKPNYDEGSCGPRRNGPVIVQRITRSGGGVHYQDYLTDASARKLLSAVRPTLVLSGHDHDQCTATHNLDGGGDGERGSRRGGGGVVTEHTVGTFSWLQGNSRPSFMLMTLRGAGAGDERRRSGGGGRRGGDEGEEEEEEDVVVDDDDVDFDAAGAVATSLCFLPRHLWTLRAYAYLGVLTAAALLLLPSVRIAVAALERRKETIRTGGDDDVPRRGEDEDDAGDNDGDDDRDKNKEDGDGDRGGEKKKTSKSGIKVFYAANTPRRGGGSIVFFFLAATTAVRRLFAFLVASQRRSAWRYFGPFATVLAVIVPLYLAMLFFDLSAR